MWIHIEKAGWIGYVLVGLSVLSLTVIFERIMFWLSQGRSLRQDAKERIIEAFGAGDRDMVKEILERYKGPQARALEYVVEHLEVTDDSPLDIAMGREVKATNRWLLVLEVNGGIAPMFGILGTVLGIIQSFQGMKGSTPDTGVMVSGLSVSMLTTAIGLIVAIISLVPYNVLASKAQRCQAGLAELLQECWLAKSKAARGSSPSSAMASVVKPQKPVKQDEPDPEPAEEADDEA